MKKLIDKKKNSSKTESSLLSAKFNGLTNKDDVDQLSKYIKNTIDYLNYKEHDVNKLYEIYKYLKGISNSIRTIYFDAADKCGKCFLNKDYNLNTCIDLLKPLYENGYEIYYNYFFFENKNNSTSIKIYNDLLEISVLINVVQFDKYFIFDK